MPLLRSGSFVTTVTPVALIVTAFVARRGLGLLAPVTTHPGFGRHGGRYSDDPAHRRSVRRRPTDGSSRGTFALSSALAGLAGFMMTAYYGGVGYGYGLTLGLKALVAAIVGGIGSVGGGLRRRRRDRTSGSAVVGYDAYRVRDIADLRPAVSHARPSPGWAARLRDLLPRRV